MYDYNQKYFSFKCILINSILESREFEKNNKTELRRKMNTT